ncbi:MAG TPA: BON domain-containing protein [Nitrospirota bacterium]
MKDIRRIVIVAAVLVLAGYLLACSGSNLRRSTGEYVDDKMIGATVKTDLAADPITKATQIEVEVFKGVVQLSGFVDSKEAQTRAGDIARKVKGVVDVKNNTLLRTQQP